MMKSLQRAFLRDRKDVEEIFGGRFICRDCSSTSKKAPQLWVYSEHNYIPTKIFSNEETRRKRMLLLLLGLEMAGTLVPGLKEKARHLQGRFENSINIHDAKIAQKIAESLSMNIGVADALKNDTQAQQFYLDIIEAIQEKKVLFMNYDNPEKREKEAVFLAPWEIFFKHHDWYFRGADLASQEGREFRLTRILSLERVSEKTYIPMPDHIKKSFDRCSKRIPLDPRRAARNQKVFSVSLLIDQPFADSVDRVCWFPGEKKQWVEKEGKKILSYQVDVEDLWEISKWVLYGAACMQILSPEELRQKVTGDIQKLLSLL
jgi:predicted DNA-binding transcriptional regulator YafY